MNATALFETLVHASDPTPYFQMWNDIPESIFVEFDELLFQDQPGEYFTQRFCFEDIRAYPLDPKRIDWVLELAITLEYTPERLERVLSAYKVWQLEQSLRSVEIRTD